MNHITATQKAPKPHIAALDGLRFLAALSVVCAHYANWTLPSGPLTDFIGSFSGLGMTLFFVLSGIVIHYNYGAALTQSGGLRRFIIARFSRLYPLYILLLTIEFVVIWQHREGSCGSAGHVTALAFGLPYYLTLTQDWTFGVICKNNLIYQYGDMAQVTWSISAEIFFYAIYCFYAKRAISAKASTLFVIAGIYYALLFVFVRECFDHSYLVAHTASAAFGVIATEQNGYQDSLIRWLYYFFPLSQMVHFIAGVAIAQALLTSKITARHVNALVTLAVSIALVVHLYLYGFVAPHDGFIGRNASTFYGPLVVAAIYTIAMCPQSLISRFLSMPFMIKCGEASYSLYLLHAFFRPAILQMQPHWMHTWTLWVSAIILMLCASRISYLCLERPMRNVLRNLLSGPVAQTNDQFHLA